MNIRIATHTAGWLHRADDGAVQQPDGVTYYLGGRTAYRVDGTIETERRLARNTIAFRGGVLRAASLGLDGRLLGLFDARRDLDILVLGGHLSAHGGRSRAHGFLRTRFVQPGTQGLDVAFYFAPTSFGGHPNSFTSEDLLGFDLWGNNTRRVSGRPVGDDSLRIGIDLHAEAVVRACA